MIILAVAPSGDTVNGDRKGRADLTHAGVTESSKSLGQGGHADAFDGIEVDGRPGGDGIFTDFQHNLTPKSPNIRCTRRDERSAESRDGNVSRQYDNRTTRNLRELAPPNLSTDR
jgi:hypothetical protein